MEVASNAQWRRRREREREREINRKREREGMGGGGEMSQFVSKMATSPQCFLWFR